MPPRAPLGLCPRCLWNISMDDSGESDEAQGDPWMLLGDYELFEEIARGGMGIVYRARQRRLARTVALKVLRGGEFADASTRKRFHTEAEAAARLHHPGIVSIHDVGEDAGVLWFSMDFISGGNLLDRVRENPLPARDAAQCVARVASAVQHAHEHGVLHRDLKPSNILLDDEGLPRVTDFGIARQFTPDATIEAELTRTGQMLGSPGYAAPEQALGGHASVRTDVYGLGALLYYLLTGRPPFQGPTLDSILLQLRENEPVAPRRLNPTVPRDLETICLHCLHKDPVRRYATAEEVMDDLGRFLRDASICARPVPPIGHAVRWVRRHPTTAGLIAFSLALIVASLVSAFAFLKRQTQLEHRAVLLATAQAQRTAAIDGSRTRALAALREAWSIQPSDEIRNEAIACLTLPEITFEKTEPSSPPAAEIPSVTFRGPEIFIADAHPEKTLRTLKHPMDVLVADSRDGLVAASCKDRILYIWDADTGKLVHRLSGHEGTPTGIAFAPDRQEIATIALDGYLRLWHAARGTELLHVDGSPQHKLPMWWSPDGQRLYLQQAEGSGIDVYRVDWPRSVKILAPPGDEPRTENIHTLSLSPDGRLAAVVDETKARVWDVARGRLVSSVAKGPSEWLSLGFAPDGSALWLCGFDVGLLRLPILHPPGGKIEIPAPQKLPTYPGMLLAGIRPDGRQLLLSNNTDGFWLLQTPDGAKASFSQTNPLLAAFTPDNRLLATSSYSNSEIVVSSLPDGKFLRKLTTSNKPLMIDFTPDGRGLWILTGTDLQRLETKNWQSIFTTSSIPLRGLVFSGDGQLAASQERGALRLLRASDLHEIARLAIPPVAGSPGNATLNFSADGTTLAAHTSLGTLVVWNLPELRKELRELGMDFSEGEKN